MDRHSPEGPRAREGLPGVASPRFRPHPEMKSPMNRRKALLLLAIALLVAGSALLIRETREAPAADASTAKAQARAVGNPWASSTAGAPMRESTRGPVRTPEDLVSYLRSRYGKNLGEPHTQMRMLEELMRHFQKLNPSGWEADLLAMLQQSFPERYAELALRLRQRQDYERWVEEHPELREKPAAERRAAVWEERNRLFGKDVAEKLWAAELRNTAVADALAAIDALPDASLRDRMARYKQSLDQTYGAQSQAYVQAHQQELMSRFLDLTSVQKELEAMAPEQRVESLRTIRREMGLDEEALKRWDELDKQRDVRWELGSRYMSEREALAQRYSGADLETRLQELRARYFSDEAQTIAEEEASGFFRFTRPRVWGRN
jgi:hypothetical protein